jgi:hypothetical protein
VALVYFHSSAFVKLVVEEKGSDLAATLWDACDADLAEAKKAWEDFWVTTRAVELTPTVTLDAGRLASEHALLGADAVHLASAQAIGSPELIFAVWDERLRAGAPAIDLETVPADR